MDGRTGVTPRRAPLWLNPEEADAFLSVLMSAPPVADVCPRLADRLMCRVATVRRTLMRPAPAAVRRRRPRLSKVRHGSRPVG